MRNSHKRDLIAQLKKSRRLLAFALSLAGGLAMVGVGLLFLGPYLQYPKYIGDRYTGPAAVIILLWIGSGITAAASSALLMVFPRDNVTWGVVVFIVSSIYLVWIVLLGAVFGSSVFRVPDGFLFAIPGVLGVLGGVLALARPPEGWSPA